VKEPRAPDYRRYRQFEMEQSDPDDDRTSIYNSVTRALDVFGQLRLLDEMRERTRAIEKYFDSLPVRCRAELNRFRAAGGLTAAQWQKWILATSRAPGACAQRMFAHLQPCDT
jgi:hypothetical protein